MKTLFFFGVLIFLISGFADSIPSPKNAAISAFTSSTEIAAARSNCRDGASAPAAYTIEFNDDGGITTLLVIQPCSNMSMNAATAAIAVVAPNFSAAPKLTYDVTSLRLVDLTTLTK